MTRNKFVLYKLDYYCTIFLVTKKGAEDLPIITYGILKVSEGKSGEIYCNRKAISEELTESKELERLEEEAKKQYEKMRKKVKVARQ